MTDAPHPSHAYLVGGGIASLAAAAFLIRDGGLPGENIHILEELPIAGGSMDGREEPGGYVTRGGRMLEEEAYACLWNLLETIPTLTDESVSVRQEITEFNAKWPTDAKARLIGKGTVILDAADYGLDTRDRLELTRLLVLPESVIGARRIEDFFSPHFFATNFWTMWRTTFAFQNWHSAIELKRYLLRFMQEFPRMHTLAGVRRTRLNQYDSIIRPIRVWLEERGVRFEHGVRVTDVDFTTEVDGTRRATRLHLDRAGQRDSYELGADDYAFLTLGSMTADAAYGSDTTAPELVRDKRDGGWRLWEAIAGKADDFGRPTAFNGNVDEAKWESFTLTMRSPLLLHRIEELSGNLPGTGALMTFKDSSWLMSIVVPHAPHFEGQPEDVYTVWGYGLFVDREGDFVGKPMAEATGREILTELLGHLGLSDAEEQVAATTTVIPVMMPYITSQFAPRTTHDRPLVIPRGAANFAFLGQFTEIPEDVVFTVEYSVRGAMHAVYGLLGLDDHEIPGIYHALADPRTAFDVLAATLA
ncbi:oleate hydratase [Streptomyces sp. HUAS TT20]|uniref:oleate hydratase n=1 Tax=Streptomyces sp. HUAS TT20 TaxID=3447509 RepID=UPI0021DB1F6A|nr:oleate hydratase [Streptomyces sp. HUAS 15-9]UXY25338.1 oleate hydratase [Streptomyces sp. HUAS 15-9]